MQVQIVDVFVLEHCEAICGFCGWTNLVDGMVGALQELAYPSFPAIQVDHCVFPRSNKAFRCKYLIPLEVTLDVGRSYKEVSPLLGNDHLSLAIEERLRVNRANI